MSRLKIRLYAWSLALVTALAFFGSVASGVESVARSPEFAVPLGQTPSASAIIDATRVAKAQVEALGHVFKTPEQVEQTGFDENDRLRAVLVTIRVADALRRQCPLCGIGLEFYGGSSGIVPPGGTEPVSFDIVLLSREGPSVDILGAGVTPQALIDESTDPAVIAAWKRDWRAPLALDPGPVPDPDPDPSPDDPEVWSRIEAKVDTLLLQNEALVRIEDAIARLSCGPDVSAQLAEIKALITQERPIELGIRLLGTAQGRIKAIQ